MALFGGEQRIENAGTDNEVRYYTLGDHAAARMITEDGEVEGKNTKHWEYMTDQYYNQEQDHYASYALRKRKNDDGTFSWVSDGHAAMAGAELAKQERREQARIAWHSIMSEDGRDIYEGTLAKAKRAIISEPGFMQDRTAPKVVFNTTDADEIADGKETFLKDGEIIGDDITVSRFKQIDKVDKELLLAFIAGAVGKSQEEVREIIADKGKIVVTSKDGTKKVDINLRGIEDIKKQAAESKSKKKTGGGGQQTPQNPPAGGAAGPTIITPPEGFGSGPRSTTIFGPDGRPLNTP